MKGVFPVSTHPNFWLTFLFLFFVFSDGQLPGSKPPVYDPPQNTEEVRPTKTLVPYQPQEIVQPPAPVPIQSYATPSPGNH